jgi:hypothetical protein
VATCEGSGEAELALQGGVWSSLADAGLSVYGLVAFGLGAFGHGASGLIAFAQSDKGAPFTQSCARLGDDAVKLARLLL